MFSKIKLEFGAIREYPVNDRLPDPSRAIFAARQSQRLK